MAGVNLVLFQELNEVPFYYGGGRGAAVPGRCTSFYGVTYPSERLCAAVTSCPKATDVEQLIFRRPLTRQLEPDCFMACLQVMFVWAVLLLPLAVYRFSSRCFVCLINRYSRLNINIIFIVRFQIKQELIIV